MFNVQLLNEDFYTNLSAWYYYALSKIKLPIKPEYYKTERENVKNFTVRLICRTIFCWFLKEKGLINPQLLEIDDKKNKLLKDQAKESFHNQNSYYRGILQNIFFASLNTPMVPEKGRSKNSYYGRQYLLDDFDFGLFDSIPFLNGGLFEKLEEDNCNDTFDDGAISIPNELFYSDEIHSVIGNKTKETKGLNKLLAQYKFTVAENTPLEEEIALDPELLGLVFENLLAEIDPDENVAKVARKATGSFYTPRKIIDYMVNESLLLYLKNYFKESKLDNSKLNALIYFEQVDADDKSLRRHILNALDDLKVLDPACGSGAFPMGMLHKVVTLLNLVDPENEMWIEAQLQKLSPELRQQASKDLKRHELNYARKLGLVRNCIYGIDIQPMAVMITKLRFFISLLIEQDIDKTELKENYHISPLPNLETKILCADSLRDAQPQLDIFHQDSFDKLIIAKE